VDIRTGELGGMLKLRDEVLQEIMDDLDQWTLDFVREFNAVHAAGYDLNDTQSDDTKDFFKIDDEGSAALNIRVAEYLIGVDGVPGDVRLIRASSLEGVKGNGDNALKLAKLRTEKVVSPPTNSNGAAVSIGDAFNAIISQIGVRAQEAIRMTENQVVLENHLINLKESISGVSLDEEMANMIRFQHAYSAAARMMTAVDEMLSIIINRLGIVGR